MRGQSVAGVIATFNQEVYIREALESLVNQVDELIVVNDCSTDGTARVLDSVHHPNLRVIHNGEQLGVSRSFNRAVEASAMDVLLIQGGDDRSLPGRAERQREVFADPAVTLTYSLPKVIATDGLQLPDEIAGEFMIGSGDVDPLVTLYFKSNFICAPAAAVRRSDYLDHGGFHPGLDLLQDYALWLALAQAGRVVVTDEPVVEYRKHGSNLSREYVGIDSSRRRRFAAEEEYIRSRFVERADRLTLGRLARGVGLDTQNHADLAMADLVALIELAHGSRNIAKRGLFRLLDIATERDAKEHLHKMGLTLREIAFLADRIDPDNLEGVGQALAAIRSLRKLSETARG